MRHDLLPLKLREPLEQVSPTPAFRKKTTSITTRLSRGFEIEIEQCARCGGRLEVIASIEEPDLIERILAAGGFARIDVTRRVAVAEGAVQNTYPQSTAATSIRDFHKSNPKCWNVARSFLDGLTGFHVVDGG